MTFRVSLTATAQKERKRLDHETRHRIDDALKNLINVARPAGSRKLSGSRYDWRIRVGDYRILYEIDDEEAVIIVWRIAHRREAYRSS